jgi:dephospho-CoA kinase
MVILVTSRSGQGKTYFCRQFLKHISAAYFNNDDVRKQTANHSFSMEGRLLAAQNMRQLIDQSAAEIKLVDMICPTKELRAVIAPDVIVFIDSDKPSKYPDTDAIYEKPLFLEAKYFFSCWTRKSDRLVERVVWFLQNFPRIPDI